MHDNPSLKTPIGYPILSSRSKSKKKSFLLMEALVALALLAMCVFPFIPKQSQKILRLKEKAAPGLYIDHFENHLCDLREKALCEGEEWIKDKKVGSCIQKTEESLYFEEIKLRSDAIHKLYLYSVYDSKNRSKKLYRLKLESLYKGKSSSKKQTLVAYLTLEV
jgi:hypothetical protein